MKFTGSVIVFCCLVLDVAALPFTLGRQNILKASKDDQNRVSKAKRVGCDVITKYSVNWFIDNAPVAKKPKPSTCLFYTRGLSLKARDYAHKKADPPMTTIWDVWPGGFYNKKMTSNNPLRCIMQNKKTDQKTYFENMSKAFASLCDIYAMVMDGSVTPGNETPFNTINKAGIWFKTEFPTLQEGYMQRRVSLVEAISPDGLTMLRYWTRMGIAAASEDFRGIFGKRGLKEETRGGTNDDEADLNWWDEDDVLADMDVEDWTLDAE